MFLEEDYVNPDEPSGVSVADNGCIWAGCLYQRKSRGFDLCNEHTGVKRSFVSSRRILRLLIGDKAKRLCVVSERQSRRRVSVPHMVSADSRRRKYISTSHDQPRQSLFGSLVGTLFLDEAHVFQRRFDQEAVVIG